MGTKITQGTIYVPVKRRINKELKMKKLLRIQQKLIPQVIELMERRYLLLRQISLSEPVGRRSFI